MIIKWREKLVFSKWSNYAWGPTCPTELETQIMSGSQTKCGSIRTQRKGLWIIHIHLRSCLSEKRWMPSQGLSIIHLMKLKTVRKKTAVGPSRNHYTNIRFYCKFRIRNVFLFSLTFEDQNILWPVVRLVCRKSFQHNSDFFFLAGSCVLIEICFALLLDCEPTEPNRQSGRVN